MNGVIIVNKPQEFTSFDVVAKLRGILRERKIGHGGTLDPMATGVLPVFVGNATKLCDYLGDHEKTYEAEMTLGIATDSEDIWGNVTEEIPAPEFSTIELEAAFSRFRGKYDQTPPMVSAKKIDGHKLYDLARQGKEIERPAVTVEISELTLLENAGEKVRFRVTCSKGTYIRTLCKDIGQALGIPACMSALKRLKHGAFSIEDAFTLEEIENHAKAGESAVFLRSTADVFTGLRDITVTEQGLRFLLNGNELTKDETHIEGDCGKLIPDELFRVFSEDGRFLAVYRYVEETGRFRAYKMFLSGSGNEGI